MATENQGLIKHYCCRFGKASQIHGNESLTRTLDERRLRQKEICAETSWFILTHKSITNTETYRWRWRSSAIRYFISTSFLRSDWAYKSRTRKYECWDKGKGWDSCIQRLEKQLLSTSLRLFQEKMTTDHEQFFTIFYFRFFH